MSTETSPGWYPAPDASDLLRWWDGEMWTDRARPAPDGQRGPSAGVTGHPSLSVQHSPAVAAQLEPGERIEAGFSTMSLRPRFFVATGHRVLILKPQGFRGRTHEVISFGFDEIDTLGFSSLTGVNMTVGDAEYKGSSVSDVTDFISYVRHRMPREGPVDLASLPAPQAADAPAADDDEDSLADDLVKLAKLHTDGLLSDREFTDAKAKLIAEA